MDDNNRLKKSLKLSAISFLKVLKPKISRKRKQPTTSTKEPAPSNHEVKRGGKPSGFLRLNRT